MRISERITSTVEDWRKAWGEALKSFLVTFLSFGLEAFMDVIGKAFAPKLKPLIDTLEATGKVPPEIQPILDEIKEPKGEIAAILAASGGSAAMSGAIGMVIEQVFADIARALASTMRKTWIDTATVMEGWKRGKLTDTDLYEFLKFSGFPDPQHEVLKDLTTIRLDPMSIVTAWLRDKPKYEKLFKDLTDQGWTPDRVEVAKELAKTYPPLPDMVRFADYGSFDPKIIAEWREMYDAPAFITEPFATIGITNEPPWEWASKYWFSHWTQPGRFELNDMFRRGLLSGKIYPAGRTMTPAEIEEGRRILKITYLTQGYSTYWQDKLADTVKEIPTRVDVRRFWDMRTISEDRLREIYQARGYFDQDLEDYVLWTKVYVAFPDLMARWSKGWISLDDVRSELTAIGMPAERLEEFIQMKVKATEPERVESERNLTKTDIYKGVKTGRITREQAIELLMELGFEEDEADYLLFINIPRDEEDMVVESRKISKADILKGLKTAVITRPEALTKLLELRYSPADAELLLKIYDAQVEVPVEPKLREASKADIVLGVTKGLIDQSEAYAMLLDLGFTPEASDFILMVKTEESPFSPINFPEFKELTTKYRRAAGREIVEMPEELKKAADLVVKLTGEVEALERSVEKEQRKLIKNEVVPEAATKRLTELQVKLHRAESELARAESEYKSQLAEWRHGLT